MGLGTAPDPPGMVAVGSSCAWTFLVSVTALPAPGVTGGLGAGNLKAGFAGAPACLSPALSGRVTFNWGRGPEGGLGFGGPEEAPSSVGPPPDPGEKSGLGATGAETGGLDTAAACACNAGGAGAEGLNALMGLLAALPGFGGKLMRMVSFLILP